MQNRYYIVFKVQIDGQTQESSRIIALDAPIQYDSDLNQVAEYLMQELKAEGVLIINWQPLVAAQRPPVEGAPSIEEQSRQVAEQIVDKLAKTPRKPAAKKAPAKAAPRAAKPSSRRK